MLVMADSLDVCCPPGNMPWGEWTMSSRVGIIIFMDDIFDIFRKYFILIFVIFDFLYLHLKFLKSSAKKQILKSSPKVHFDLVGPFRMPRTVLGRKTPCTSMNTKFAARTTHPPQLCVDV